MNKLAFTIRVVIKYQLIQGVFAILLFSMFNWFEIYIVISSVLGVFCALIPTLAYYVFIDSKKKLNYIENYKLHKKASLAKYVLNILGLLIIFISFKSVNGLVLLLSYIITLAAYYTSIIEIIKKSTRSNNGSGY